MSGSVEDGKASLIHQQHLSQFEKGLFSSSVNFPAGKEGGGNNALHAFPTWVDMWAADFSQ